MSQPLNVSSIQTRNGNMLTFSDYADYSNVDEPSYFLRSQTESQEELEERLKHTLGYEEIQTDSQNKKIYVSNNKSKYEENNKFIPGYKSRMDDKSTSVFPGYSKENIKEPRLTPRKTPNDINSRQPEDVSKFYDYENVSQDDLDNFYIKMAKENDALEPRDTTSGFSGLQRPNERTNTDLYVDILAMENGFDRKANPDASKSGSINQKGVILENAYLGVTSSPFDSEDTQSNFRDDERILNDDEAVFGVKVLYAEQDPVKTEEDVVYGQVHNYEQGQLPNKINLWNNMNGRNWDAETTVSMEWEQYKSTRMDKKYKTAIRRMVNLKKTIQEKNEQRKKIEEEREQQQKMWERAEREDLQFEREIRERWENDPYYNVENMEERRNGNWLKDRYGLVKFYIESLKNIRIKKEQREDAKEEWLRNANEDDQKAKASVEILEKELGELQQEVLQLNNLVLKHTKVKQKFARII